MPSLIDSQETLDWDALIVVMAFKIAGSRAARQPHVIYHYSNTLHRSEVVQCFWKLLNQLDEKSRVSVGFAPALLPALHGSWVSTDCSGKEGT